MRRMHPAILVLACTLCCSGCASLSTTSFYARYTQQQKLSRAVDLLGTGNTGQATGLLAEVAAGKGFPGVTDEALFRLALLSVGDGTDPSRLQQARQLLERLKKEYPDSPWTAQGASLTDFLTNIPKRYDLGRGKKLAEALRALREGDADTAAKLLDEISRGKAADGVTDEALFRLALLSIDTEPERQQNSLTSNLLGRLETEYPESPWTLQAAGLSELLENLSQKFRNNQEMRRQIKSFKDMNQHLIRENKELRLNIERLKNLDLELERKK